MKIYNFIALFFWIFLFLDFVLLLEAGKYLQSVIPFFASAYFLLLFFRQEINA